MMVTNDGDGLVVHKLTGVRRMRSKELRSHDRLRFQSFHGKSKHVRFCATALGRDDILLMFGDQHEFQCTQLHENDELVHTSILMCVALHMRSMVVQLTSRLTKLPRKPAEWKLYSLLNSFQHKCHGHQPAKRRFYFLSQSSLQTHSPHKIGSFLRILSRTAI